MLSRSISTPLGWTTETETISKVVNSFFGWEFNCAEMLVAGDEAHPID